MRRYALLIGIALATLSLDQIAKALIVSSMGGAKSVAVIPGFFDLTLVYNRGAAFGFLNNPDTEWQFWLFLGATAVAIWAIFTLARQGGALLLTGLGLILGGAAGNLLDRLRYRAVTDFLDFYWGAWHWPAFNIADIGICIGVGLAGIASLSRKDAEK